MHIFGHKFRDYVSPMCNSGAKIETSKKLFLALPNCLPVKDKISMTTFIWSKKLSDRSFSYKFWWRISIKCCNGSDELNDKINCEILLSTIYYIKSTKRFEKLFLASANPHPFLFPATFAFFSIYVLLYIYICNATI